MSENSNNNHLQRLLEEINHFNTYNDYFFPTPLYNHYYTQEPINRVLTESLYDRNPIKYVITEEVKTSLVPIKFKDAIEKENNEKCSITVETFKDEDEIIQLPCNHCFFVEPIMKWLTEDSCECPICRYKFESIEKKEEPVDEVMEEQLNSTFYNDIDIDEPYYYINSNHNMLFSQMINSIFSDFYGTDNASNIATYYSVEHPTPMVSRTTSPSLSDLD